MNVPRSESRAEDALRTTDLDSTSLTKLVGLARESRRPVTALLTEAWHLDDAAAAATLARHFDLPLADFRFLSGRHPRFDLLPFTECSRLRAVVVSTHGNPSDSNGGAPVLATAEPCDTELIARIEETIGRPVDVAVVSASDVAAYLNRQEDSRRALEDVSSTGEVTANGNALDLTEVSLDRIATSDSNVVRIVDATVYDALKSGASDIHLETLRQGLAIKYRIDGVLVAIQRLGSSEVAEQILSRIKVLAKLDIAERRIPQDGRFRVRARGREIDFRVSIMPSVFGEDAVLRVLDKQSLATEAQGLTLERLGFTPAIIEGVRELAAQPYGMLLVTGPTGSGKTTTLYAVISEVHRGEDKIITIEDPVEYQLPGILQIPVNERKGLTFAKGLRSILRHDPDRIMVGEIRDAETAEIALQAALTGHTVFTTVHANNVLDVIGRFLHMKVDPYNFVAALNGVLAQRLLRTNCPSCTEATSPTEALLRRSKIPSEQLSGFEFRKGKGCAHCRGTGFKSRRAIGELLFLSDRLRAAIVARAPVHELKAMAQEAGTMSLRQAALALVAQGETSLEEANRVTFVE